MTTEVAVVGEVTTIGIVVATTGEEAATIEEVTTAMTEVVRMTGETMAAVAITATTTMTEAAIAAPANQDRSCILAICHQTLVAVTWSRFLELMVALQTCTS